MAVFALFIPINTDQFLLYISHFLSYCFNEPKKTFLLKYFFLVHLVGGIDVSEGNVLAYNPANGMYGPVCDDMWNLEDVTNFVMLVLTIFLFIT
jgi:hypothetical protein